MACGADAWLRDRRRTGAEAFAADGCGDAHWCGGVTDAARWEKEEKTEKDGACAPWTQVNINDITAPAPAGGGGGMRNVRRFAQMEDGALKKATFSDDGGGCSLICQMWGRRVKSAPYLVKK